MAEHELPVGFEGALRRGLLAVVVVHFAGMAAQLLDRRGSQASVSEGLHEHIQQGNELGVVKGVLVVVAKPVIELDLPEVQQNGFQDCLGGGRQLRAGAIIAISRRGLGTGGQYRRSE